MCAEKVAEFGNFLLHSVLLLLDLHQASLELSVLLVDDIAFSLELLNLLSLALSRGLSSLPVSQDTLDAALLLLIFSLCPLAMTFVSLCSRAVDLVGSYRGGRFVFGVGSS